MHIASHTSKASIDAAVAALAATVVTTCRESARAASAKIATIPAGARFAVAASLLTLTHIWAGVLGQTLVHWIYSDWSRPNLAFWFGIGWMAVSLTTWGVSLLRVGEWLGVWRRITPEVTR